MCTTSCHIYINILLDIYILCAITYDIKSNHFFPLLRIQRNQKDVDSLFLCNFLFFPFPITTSKSKRSKHFAVDICILIKHKANINYECLMLLFINFCAPLVYCCCSMKQLTSVFASTNFGIAINLSRRNREREKRRMVKQCRDLFFLVEKHDVHKAPAEEKINMKKWRHLESERFHIAPRKCFAYETCVLRKEKIFLPPKRPNV